MNKNIVFLLKNSLTAKCLKNRTIIFLLFFIVSEMTLFGQNTSSFKFGMKNNSHLNKYQVDSIYKNNQLCQKYPEVVMLDTLYWSQYPKVNIDSIPRLHRITANELAEQTLDIMQSNYYSKQSFNLIGTYSENEMRNDTNISQYIKTKVKVYDPGFTSNSLPKARTEKCDNVYKSNNILPSIPEVWKTTLGGLYSNLYYILDLDFLRMYNFQSSGHLGGDRRIWSAHNFNSEHVSDDYRYYKAFIKDSSIYVVLVSKREYSILDLANKPNSSIKLNFPKEFKPVTSEFKYILVNLRTSAIEKTGYYTTDSLSNNSSMSSSPNRVTSYETSYKLIGNQYFLDQVSCNNFLFGPKINLISLSGISFHVDSVVIEPKKVEKISDSQSDPRKVNYLEQYLKNINWRVNEKN